MNLGLIHLRPASPACGRWGCADTTDPSSPLLAPGVALGCCPQTVAAYSMFSILNLYLFSLILEVLVPNNINIIVHFHYLLTYVEESQSNNSLPPQSQTTE